MSLRNELLTSTRRPCWNNISMNTKNRVSHNLYDITCTEIFKYNNLNRLILWFRQLNLPHHRPKSFNNPISIKAFVLSILLFPQCLLLAIPGKNHENLWRSLWRYLQKCQRIFKELQGSFIFSSRYSRIFLFFSFWPRSLRKFKDLDKNKLL